VLYKHLIKPIFFLFDAEKIHNFVLGFFSRFTFIYPLMRFFYFPCRGKAIEIEGIKFRSRLGLAAGFDKNGIALRFWEAVGFSHVEAGTVTPLPQPGNDKPRIFRLPDDNALINRLGFNNKGADEIRKNILEAKKKISKDFVIGVNIGKNKVTPVENAVNDYLICFEKLYDAADYFTINISSPNTEGLRKLQGEEYLNSLLQSIQKLNLDISAVKGKEMKVVFLKIAPDLTEEELIFIYNAACRHMLNGIIATNTTISRENLSTNTNEAGGLSGKPLKAKADSVLNFLNNLNLNNKEKRITLIGAGGVFDKSDYRDKLNNGAALVQVYTGFIYKGPAIIKKLLCS
jgi:dihydroorotate dehydrogenase